MVLPEGCLQSGFGVVRHRDPAHVQGAVLEAAVVQFEVAPLVPVEPH